MRLLQGGQRLPWPCILRIWDDGDVYKCHTKSKILLRVVYTLNTIYGLWDAFYRIPYRKGTLALNLWLHLLCLLEVEEV